MAQPQLPVDPDLPAEPLRHPPPHLLRGRLDILAVIAAGGAVGSAARHGVAEALPHQPATVAWSTFTVNVVGGFLLGLLMVFVMDVWPPTRCVRPFFGVGVPGGFTTFSTYMVDTRALLAAGEVVAAPTYVVGTLVVGLAAVWLGVFGAPWLSTCRVGDTQDLARKTSPLPKERPMTWRGRCCAPRAGKRVAPMLAVLVPLLHRDGELGLTDAEAALLVQMSAATIDRRLAGEGQHDGVGPSHTKPGSLLKFQIPGPDLG